MAPTDPKRFLPLCHRCEWRAVYHETGSAARYECSRDGAVVSCYMFSPAKPLVMEPDPGDRRPLGGPWMLSARAHAVALGDCELVAKRKGRRLLAYWRPR
jgi:hypothetical protein